MKESKMWQLMNKFSRKLIFGSHQKESCISPKTFCMWIDRNCKTCSNFLTKNDCSRRFILFIYMTYRSWEAAKKSGNNGIASGFFLTGHPINQFDQKLYPHISLCFYFRDGSIGGVVLLNNKYLQKSCLIISRDTLIFTLFSY